MRILHSEISGIKENIAQLYERGNNPYEGLEMTVMSISDTIVMYNFSDDCGLSLNFHARNTILLLTRLLQKHLPLRGATCYGEFDVIDNIYMGPAIDEVAAWYEAIDWIGSIITPSAIYECAAGPYDEFAYIDYPAPSKKFGRIDTKCIIWPVLWETLENKNIEDLKKILLNMGPITPDIALKFNNTLNFYNKVKKAHGAGIQEVKENLSKIAPRDSRGLMNP